MTQNFVDYLNYRESARSHAASEQIAHESNQITYALGTANLAESIRHNTVGEVETNRHNVVVEKETKRHNKAMEKVEYEKLQLGYANLDLGYAQLAESKRHSLVSESISQMTNEISRLNTLSQVALGYSQLAELTRSNKVKESQGWYAEFEKARHNTVQENLSYENYNLSLENWSLAVDRLKEEMRHNIASESINQANADSNVYGQLGALLRGLGSIALVTMK